jgi:hypothetical protein
MGGLIRQQSPHLGAGQLGKPGSSCAIGQEPRTHPLAGTPIFLQGASALASPWQLQAMRAPVSPRHSAG